MTQCIADGTPVTKLLEDIDKRRVVRLLEWEEKFIISLQTQLAINPKRRLSTLQVAKLEEIWEKVT